MCGCSLLLVTGGRCRGIRLELGRSETLLDRLQGTETAQSQFEHPLLNRRIIQYFNSLSAPDADAHLFTGRERDRIDAHCIEVINTLLGREKILLFSVAKPQR